MSGTLYWFECKVCKFDSDEANVLFTEDEKKGGPICAICAGDTGHRNKLTIRPATKAEIERLPK